MGVIAFAPFNKAEPRAFLLKFILMLVLKGPNFTFKYLLKIHKWIHFTMYALVLQILQRGLTNVKCNNVIEI